MLMQSEIEQKLQSAFEPQQAEVLLEVISLSYNNLVKVSDFTELKAIVQEFFAVAMAVYDNTCDHDEALSCSWVCVWRQPAYIEPHQSIHNHYHNPLDRACRIGTVQG